MTSSIVSAEYADHDNTAAYSTYDDGKTRYVVMNSNSKHKRDLDAWVAAGNEIAPCTLPPGAERNAVSLKIDALEDRVAELESLSV